MLNTLDEIRDNIASTIRDTQIETILTNYINLAGLEIHNYHPWSFLRRKQTFSTGISQEDYNLDSEVDRIAILREITTPNKLYYLPDHLFYRFLPNPESLSTGSPRYYRLWEETGFSTNLAADDTLYVKSSSTSDGSTFNVRVVGRDSSGEEITETLTLNGTTAVTSSTTWDDGGLKYISKSAVTTGTVTAYRTTGNTVLSELEPDNLTPRYKRMSLYPIPSAVITMYLEYYERYRYLAHNTDVPQLDVKWNWVLREGALAKAWGYKQNETQMQLSQQQFEKGLKLMRAQDETNLDFVPVLQPRIMRSSIIRRNSDSVNNAFPSYSLDW